MPCAARRRDQVDASQCGLRLASASFPLADLPCSRYALTVKISSSPSSAALYLGLPPQVNDGPTSVFYYRFAALTLESAGRNRVQSFVPRGDFK